MLLLNSLIFREKRRSNAVFYTLLRKLHSNLPPGSQPSLCFRNTDGLAAFLADAGFGQSARPKPTVFLVGAGTSDYIGRSLVHVLRRLWKCEVIAVPSTSLLTHGEDWLIPGQRYVWISFSRSGDSPEGVSVIGKSSRESSGYSSHHRVV